MSDLAKQQMMFGVRVEESQKYTKKIEAPVYEPRGDKPHLLALYDTTKTKALIREIDASSLPEDEKTFLRSAAQRHTVFHYERIAEYYAHASEEMQDLMEKSALVIIDFNAAIEQGFVKLCDEIKGQFLEEYPDESA